MELNENPYAEPRDDSRWPAILTGTAFGAVLYMVAWLVRHSYGWSFFAIPFFIGLVTGALSQARGRSNALIALALGMLLSVITLREGVICLLFALPVFLPGLLVGEACGRYLRRYMVGRKQRRRTGAGMVALALLTQGVDAWFDDPARHPVHEATTDVLIDAPPEQVFAALTEERLRVDGHWPWFLVVGLPIPRSMQVTRPGPRGEVTFEFNHGRASGRITDYRPGQALAFQITRYAIEDLPFHITRLGRGNHYGLKTERVDDWLTFEEIRYALSPSPAGGTHLTRVTRWRRHLAPALYFGWLQQTIIERGQERLLEFIRERVLCCSRAPSRAPGSGALPRDPLVAHLAPARGHARTAPRAR